MHFHISTELESRDRLKILSHDLQDEIRDALMEKADGMFRWVQCQLDRLNDCWSLGDLCEVLDTLPTTLYETYERMLCAIDKKEFGGRVARRALVWLVTTLRPLTLSQLAQALAINRDNSASDSTIMTMQETDLIEICGSLVSFNERTRIITLSHYSVKEYLTSDMVADKTCFVHVARANFELATVSIYSIMLSIDKPYVDLRDRHDLSYYAMHSGLHHLANCLPEDDGPLLGLLLTFQNHVSNHRRSYATKWRYGPWITTISQLALYIIIRFGRVSLLRHYLDHHSVQLTEGANPLVYAAFYRDVPCIQVLLDQGLDVNIEATVPVGSGDMPSLPPLMTATRNHKYQEEVVSLLLARGNTVPRNAIHSVFQANVPGTCRAFTIQIRSQQGTDAMLSVNGGESRLHSLLRVEYVPPEYSNNVFEIARLLVEAGCDPAALNDSGLSPIHLALSKGTFQLVKWLIENGFRLPADAVLHAVRCPDSATLLPMLHLVFESGATGMLDVRDDNGCNALHLLLSHFTGAFHEEMEEALKLLLENGCEIDCQNHTGETPLHTAARLSTLRVVEFFIDQGAQLPYDVVNYCVTGNAFRTCGSEMSLLVRLVTIHGASCQARTIRGDNALHCLLSRDSSSREEEPIGEALFLLENGCDVHATSSSGVTVLETAIENGYLSIAQILLHQRAQPHADITPAGSDTRGNTVLHRLCYKIRSRRRLTDPNFMDRVKLLQEAGYDLARHANILNNQGHTPLGIVLRSRDPCPAIVSYLVHSGAKFSDVNPLFLDDLEWASDLRLPWYSDATEAYQRALAKHKITFGDVDRVYHLLVDHCKLPVPVVRRIMDAAEYWAYTKALRENLTIQSTLTDNSEPITLPVMPSIDTRYCMPCRVVFSCKPQGIDLDLSWDIQLSIRRQNVVYAVPLNIFVECVPFKPSRTDFGVWDEYTPEVQLNGRQRLAIEDIRSGDTLILELRRWKPELELEFFQIEVYFRMGPVDDRSMINHPPFSSESN
ncbi:hypothetical protein BU15DRAFT_79797 [Melanogaster broomeanus]|nr:hypothetical protein BU15DRAFT_79797 [Melanogaster broomeanus]